MLIPSPPKDEERRLQELYSLAVLDTARETLFDDIVKLGSYITDCPISLISLIDKDRQWFKASVGIEASETPRDISFCGHAIHQDETFIVEDASRDTRFTDNPLVTQDPSIRFYAGQPLVTSNGYRLGTLCTIDRVSKRLTPQQYALLESLARQTTFLLERRRNELYLEATRRNSQILFEKCAAIIIATKGPRHVFEYVNSAHIKLMGNVDATGKTLLEVQPEAKDTGFLAILDEVYQKGATRELKDSSFLIGEKTRHFDLLFTPSYGLKGEVDGVMGLVDDITDRKELELALFRLNEERQEKARKLAHLLEQVPIHIALYEGPEHRFQFANRLYRQDFLPGLAYEGKALAEVLPDIEQQGFVSILDGVYASGETYIGREACYVRTLPSGVQKEGCFNFIYEATKDAYGQTNGILAAILDITEQVHSRREISSKVDALSAEKEIRERFVTTLTHDLRTPLTAAKLSAEILNRKQHDPVAVAKGAKRIIQSIERGESMVRDLLDANRIKAGQGLPISPKPCDLVHIAFQSTQFLASMSKQDISFAKKDDAIAVVCDPSAIQRVIENLVNNAIKYGSKDKAITVGTRQVAGAAELYVHNEGPVLTKDEQNVLFETYKRLDNAVESGQKGWGIGLTLVKGIAEAHRGTVRVDSKEGKGTTFFFTFPHDCRKPVYSAQGQNH